MLNYIRWHERVERMKVKRNLKIKMFYVEVKGLKQIYLQYATIYILKLCITFFMLF
jgi:hypothetical protein